MIKFTAQSSGQISNGGLLVKAVEKALRGTLRSSKKDAAAAMAERYVKPTVGTKPIKISVRGLSGVIKSVGPRNPIERFKVKPRHKLKRPPKSGVFAQVLTSGGGYLTRAFHYNGAIFQRLGKPRLPIERIVTTSAPGMLKPEQVQSQLLSKIEKRFDEKLRAEVGAVL